MWVLAGMPAEMQQYDGVKTGWIPDTHGRFQPQPQYRTTFSESPIQTTDYCCAPPPFPYRAPSFYCARREEKTAANTLVAWWLLVYIAFFVRTWSRGAGQKVWGCLCVRAHAPPTLPAPTLAPKKLLIIIIGSQNKTLRFMDTHALTTWAWRVLLGNGNRSQAPSLGGSTYAIQPPTAAGTTAAKKSAAIQEMSPHALTSFLSDFAKNCCNYISFGSKADALATPQPSAPTAVCVPCPPATESAASIK